MSIDDKVKKLVGLTNEFIFVEYYSHTNKDMWKIMNEYTPFASDKLVLCEFDDGIEKALDIAIVEIEKRKHEFGFN